MEVINLAPGKGNFTKRGTGKVRYARKIKGGYRLANGLEVSDGVMGKEMAMPSFVWESKYVKLSERKK